MLTINDLQHQLDVIRGHSESQAGQDLFVLAMHAFKTNGVFLEIGCGHPRHNSNTWLLETYFGWSGISIDRQTAYEALYHAVKQPSWPADPVAFSVLPDSVQQESTEAQTGLTDDYYHSSDWRHRPNSKWIKTDAMCVDYTQIPDTIDYLQIDLDDPEDHFKLLHHLVVEQNKKFAVITFEHDVFTGSNNSRISQIESQRLLPLWGYELIANNVTIEPGRGWSISPQQPMYFEDWYAQVDMIPSEIRQYFRSVDEGTKPKYYSDILFKHH
jgi:hypothetical protein